MLNMLKTGLLLTGLTLILIWIGNLIGGQVGIIVALVFAAIMNLGSYWFSDRLVIAMSGAQPLSEQEAPQLYQMLREMTHRANMPMPRLYLIPRCSRTPSRRGAIRSMGWSPLRRACCR